MEDKKFLDGVARRHVNGTLDRASRAMGRHAQRLGETIEANDEEIRLLNIMCCADEKFVERAARIMENPFLTDEGKGEALSQSKVEVIKRAGQMIRSGKGTREQVEYFKEAGVTETGSYKISKDARMVHGGEFKKGMEKSVKRLARLDKLANKVQPEEKMSPEELAAADEKAESVAAELLAELDLEDSTPKPDVGKHTKKAKKGKGARKRG